MVMVAKSKNHLSKGERAHAERRLTKADWVHHGLSTLAQHGPNALKIGGMAEALGVSRGSFYWHFRDSAELRTEILRHWEEGLTDAVLRDLESRQKDQKPLLLLLKKAFIGNQNLHRAIRAWAVDDPVVAHVVEQADNRRIRYICDLLLDNGVASDHAMPRAEFLYWAYLGQAMMVGQRHKTVSAAAIGDIAAKFET